MKIGEYIRQYREENKLSQREFAKMCGLSNAYISMLEKGVNPSTGEPAVPSMKVYLQISQAMGISIQTLMEAVDDSVDNSSKSITHAFLHTTGTVRKHTISFMDSISKSSEESEEDKVLFRLMKNASPAAKRAAIAVLKSMEETNSEF